MDLKQRLDIVKTNDVPHEYPRGGFGGMSNRVGKKPIVIACNGHAHGTWTKSGKRVTYRSKLLTCGRRWF
jgi:hypothetical protein